MAIISVDTEKDSKQTITKVIKFLQQFVSEEASWHNSTTSNPAQATSYSSPESATPAAAPSSDMFSMFGVQEESPSAFNAPIDYSGQDLSVNSLLESSDDDEDDDAGVPGPQIISY